MELNSSNLKARKKWEERGYSLPNYDITKVTKETKENPLWIHFGAGNIFRAFQANVVQNLLNQKVLDRGLIVAEGYDYEIISKVYRQHDNLSILATLKANGDVEKTVIGSIVESLIVDSDDQKEFSRLEEIFESESLEMVSFTITEKGYKLTGRDGKIMSDVNEDFIKGPQKPKSYMGKVASLLYKRFLNNQKPIAMVSMDNCSHNGDKLYSAIKAFAENWQSNGIVEDGFAEYVNSEKVSFPWTMIDKITPRPDPKVLEILEKDNVDNMKSIVTSKNTYVAPYVNAEEIEYLVIEDDFPNGRPELEKGGVIFTDRQTVNKVEKMKVCTCLNPLHTALSIFGCLLGHTLVSEEMKDEDLRKMVEIIGYKEGLKVVVDPGIINPKEFIDEVIDIRFPNPFMPDTPQRIVTDTSQKMAIRFGETIKAYIESDELNVKDLKIIPLVIAGWLRYLTGIDDEGNKFELSADPLLESLCPRFEGLFPYSGEDVHAILKPVLSDVNIFGVDLYSISLGRRIEEHFLEMMSEKGKVREVLHKNVNA